MIRLFAHRGYHSQNVAQNSAASLKSAYNNGFRNIEFDIWFLRKKLLLKHDKPQKNEINNLAIFDDYLCYGNEFSYWLDFKNLSNNSVEEALLLIKEKLQHAAIDLNQIYFAPFITNYEIAAKIFKKFRKVFGRDLQLVAVYRKRADITPGELYNFLTKNQIGFLSVFHELIDQNFMNIFSDIEIFAWTVNDVNRLLELHLIGVRNFATDKIIPSSSALIEAGF